MIPIRTKLDLVVAATDKGLYRLSLIEDVDTSSFLKESTK